MVASIFVTVLAATSLLGWIPYTVAQAVVCEDVGGTARVLSTYRSCVCTSGRQSSLPGSDCAAPANSRAGCTNSCGNNCINGARGACFFRCNAGFTRNAEGTACVAASASGRGGFGQGRGKRELDESESDDALFNAQRQQRMGEEDGHTKTTPGTPQPTDTNASQCPRGLTACSSASSILTASDTLRGPGANSDFECFDTMTDVHACGGCPHGGVGEDCMAITGAKDVECVQGQCVISSCKPSYILQSSKASKSTCVRR